MEFALQCAYAHGTRAIRTHLDSLGPQARISFPVFAAARERWKGRIDLQASPLFGVDVMFEPGHLQTIEEMVDRYGSKLLGAVTYMIPRLQEALDTLFGLAERKGWDLDFHVDEIRRSRGAHARRDRRHGVGRDASRAGFSSVIAALWPGRTTRSDYA